MRNINILYEEILFREDKDVQVQQQSQVKIWNWYAVLENVDAYVDIGEAQRSVRDKIETSVKMNIAF